MFLLLFNQALSAEPQLWDNFPISVKFQETEDKPEDISKESIIYALAGSLGAWRVPETIVDFSLKIEGETTGTVKFSNEIPEDSEHSLGIATVWRDSLGVPFSFQLLINSEKEWTTNGEEDKYDLESCITHEIGHILGFHHTDNPDSTMYYQMYAGETIKRDLTKEDREMVADYYGVSYCGSSSISFLLVPIMLFRRKRLTKDKKWKS